MAPDFIDILYDKQAGIATITINRPEVLNAFRPLTVDELIEAFRDAGEDENIGVVVLTGTGERAFCSGGDQKLRSKEGYRDDGAGRPIRVPELHTAIRMAPKPVIAKVNGYAIGGGHVLHVVCDLSIASDNAIFGQAGPRVGSFDAGFGTIFLSRIVGEKKAREIWYLCRQYSAQEACEMGMVNAVVPVDELEAEGWKWAQEILDKSPLAIRLLKSAFNADVDGQAGIQELAGNATLLFYMTEESKEAKNAYLEKREPDFRKFPWLPW